MLKEGELPQNDLFVCFLILNSFTVNTKHNVFYYAGSKKQNEFHYQ